MPKLSSPSDFTNINANYSQGRGYYTTHTDVSQLLQIQAFSSSTTPSIAEVGSLIKRAEERVDDIESAVIHNESLQEISWFIDSLPESLKTAFVLRESEGKSYEDIAAITETPIGTVRSRIFRARELIVDFIEKEIINNE